ncbi:hypothetical protein HOK00_09460 [bacterium]|nr:hypothetical protein [bacterium]
MFSNKILEIFSNLEKINPFIISDNHFNHQNVLNFEPSRLKQMKKDGFDDHEKWMISKWNEVVKPDDIVIHLGDFAFKHINQLENKLNGIKILILGNHDRKGNQTYQNIFDYIIRGSQVVFNNKLYIAEANDLLFSSIIASYEDKTLLFSHYPATLTEIDLYESFGKKDRYEKICNRIYSLIEIADENCININIHGHTHSRNIVDNKQFFSFINSSIENIDFKPQRLSELLR